MTTPAYPFVGGEDSEFQLTGGASVITTAGRFRATIGGANVARCALACLHGSQIVQAQKEGGTPNLCSFTSGWWHAAVWMAANTSAQWSGNRLLSAPFKITDGSGVIRLAIATNAPPSTSAGSWNSVTAGSWSLYKVDAAQNMTALATFTAWIHGAPAAPDILDVQVINYGVAGTVNVYANGVLACSFTGDIHTDSNAALNGLTLNGTGVATDSSTKWIEFDWSEAVVSDSDTRSLVIATRAPVANGTTHTFDTGPAAAANVNEIVRNDTTIDGSSVALQIDGYTIDTTVPAGYGILGVVVSALLQKGSSGPSQMDLGVGIAGTYYWSSDIPLSLSMEPYQTNFGASPATGTVWGALPAEVALRSVT